MKTQMPKKDRDELLKRLAALVPFAKGSVCVSHKPCGNPWKCRKCLSGEMHPSVQYSFRENGKLRTMHVQPRFLKQVQEAVANGRTRIAFLRKKSDPKKSFGTIEVNSSGHLIQAKAFANRHLDRNAQLFVRKWAKVKKLKLSSTRDLSETAGEKGL